MARRKATSGDEPTTVDEAAAFEGIGGSDPAPGAKPTRRARSSSTTRSTGNRGRIPARTASGKIKTKAQMVEEVQAQLAVLCYGGVALWEVKDPCAELATPERVDAIIEGTTSMIARYPKALQYASSTGILGDVFKILSAAVPIAIGVIRAHGPGGHRHELEGGNADVNDARFPAFVPA